MAQRIFLHLGSHKTGTTAVQVWMSENFSRLSDAGVHIPVTGRNTRHANSRALAMALAMPKGEGHSEFANLRRAFKREIEAHKGKDFLISAEYFSLILTQPNFKLAIKRLRRFGLDPQAALVLRNPIDLINSAYAQRCKTLRLGEDFDAYLTEFFALKRGHWPMRVRRLTELGLEPKFGVYQPGRTNSPRQVMTLLGLDKRLSQRAFRATPRRNRSIGELGVLASYHLKRAMSELSEQPSRAAKDWLSDHLAAAADPCETRAFNGLRADQIANIEAKSLPQLKDLAQTHITHGKATLLRSQTGGLAQSPLTLEDIQGETRDRVEEILGKCLQSAREHPEFKRHFPLDPFAQQHARHMIGH